MNLSAADVELLTEISSSESILTDVLIRNQLFQIEASVKNREDLLTLKDLLEILKRRNFLSGKRKISIDLTIEKLADFFLHADATLYRSLFKLFDKFDEKLLSLTIKDFSVSKEAVKNFENSIKKRKKESISYFLFEVFSDFFNSDDKEKRRNILKILEYFSFDEVFSSKSKKTKENIVNYFLDSYTALLKPSERRLIVFLSYLLKNDLESIKELLSLSDKSDEIQVIFHASETIKDLLNDDHEKKKELLKRIRSAVSDSETSKIKFKEISSNLTRFEILDESFLALSLEISKIEKLFISDSEKFLIKTDKKIPLILKIEKSETEKQIKDLLSRIDSDSDIIVQLTIQKLSILKSWLLKKLYEKKKLKVFYEKERFFTKIRNSFSFQEEFDQESLSFLFKVLSKKNQVQKEKNSLTKDIFSFLFKNPLIDRKDFLSFLKENKISLDKNEFRSFIFELEKRFDLENTDELDEFFLRIFDVSKEVFKDDKKTLLSITKKLLDLSVKYPTSKAQRDHLIEQIHRLSKENKDRSEIKAKILLLVKEENFKELKYLHELEETEEIHFSQSEKSFLKKKLFALADEDFFLAFETYLLLNERIRFCSKEVEKKFLHTLKNFENSNFLRPKVEKLYKKYQSIMTEKFLRLVEKIDPSAALNTLTEKKKSRQKKTKKLL